MQVCLFNHSKPVCFRDSYITIKYGTLLSVSDLAKGHWAQRNTANIKFFQKSYSWFFLVFQLLKNRSLICINRIKYFSAYSLRLLFSNWVDSCVSCSFSTLRKAWSPAFQNSLLHSSNFVYLVLFLHSWLHSFCSGIFLLLLLWRCCFRREATILSSFSRSVCSLTVKKQTEILTKNNVFVCILLLFPIIWNMNNA